MAAGVLVIGAGAGVMSGDPDAAIFGGTCATVIAVVIAMLALSNFGSQGSLVSRLPGA